MSMHVYSSGRIFHILGVRYQRREPMQDDADLFDMPGSAVLYLDRLSGEVCGNNGAAASLLGRPGSAVIGVNWRYALGIADGSISPLAQIIGSGVSAPLPPTLICRADGEEIVVGGCIFPHVHEGREAVALLLYQLAGAGELPFDCNPAAADIIAVLGLDRLAYDPDWGMAESIRFMMDLRFSLLEIVPAQDTVGLPVGTTIPLLLRDVPVAEALDISRALLSHLQSVLTLQEQGGAVHARASIGLAPMDAQRSPMSAFVAANTALMQAQLGHGPERTRIASSSDEKLLAAHSINAYGVFGESRPGAGSCAAGRTYLAALAALVADPQRPRDYLDGVFELTLGQPGVAAAALYRLRYDGGHEYVAGGRPGKGGYKSVAEKELPRSMRDWQRGLPAEPLKDSHFIQRGASKTTILPLYYHSGVLGYLLLAYRAQDSAGAGRFIPDIAAMHQLAAVLSAMPNWREAVAPAPARPTPATAAIEADIEGYVGDNMEGAIDQAVFLSRLDMPIAVIGPRGTGKLYVAKIIHQESGLSPDKLVSIDCREFRSRREALTRIARELEQGEGKTLVFKSPHLMNPDAQVKLARQISSRILADSNPPRYLPAVRFVGLFPDSLEHLIVYGGLSDRLASVFAGYPIMVPPLKARKRAVLRWAHKILRQESTRRDRKIKGFTPDAEQAMLLHDWPGNISEMRQCILNALDKSDKEWITPVDLGIFKGISADGSTGATDKRPFLEIILNDVEEAQGYVPSVFEELTVALGEALHALLELDTIKPLGAWLDDELVLAACERYRGDMRGAAQFLQTKPRNISRWMPKILSRDHERSASLLWQKPRGLIKQWVRETAPPTESPQQLLHDILMSHVVKQCDSIGVADRARIMGVSTPTYQKRLRGTLEQ
jgi:DNA-binding NtrC family response regulator